MHVIVLRCCYMQRKISDFIYLYKKKEITFRNRGHGKLGTLPSLHIYFMNRVMGGWVCVCVSLSQE